MGKYSKEKYHVSSKTLAIQGFNKADGACMTSTVIFTYKYVLHCYNKYIPVTW